MPMYTKEWIYTVLYFWTHRPNLKNICTLSLNEAVFIDEITVSLRKTAGRFGALSLRTLPVVHATRNASDVGGQPEDSDFSLFTIPGVSRVEPCASSNSISTPRSRCCSGQQPPPPPCPITSRERKRDVSAGFKSRGEGETEELWRGF